ncbi:peptidase S8/S53 domain-containing protein [Aspergillus pseudocaelatus]|uniref:Peptidase S8/S53 domain-containing protein n=1 Tax=Aspergillus pseudocaelatus TaxID=1825620 RepID=A0ABQ6WEC2_9EURO|nr:peptidase S8/S53 domain-containing protein [Aspergillus pseudocaelatus]
MAKQTSDNTSAREIGEAQWRYFSITLKRTLDRVNKYQLRSLGVILIQFIGSNTFKCKFKGTVDDLRKMSCIESADTISPNSKMPATLQGQGRTEEQITVDVTLQRGAKQSVEQVLDSISEVTMGTASISNDSTIRTTVKIGDLPRIASLETVGAISEIYEQVLDNSHARCILQIHNGRTCHGPCDGEGEIITVADSGLDDTHDAFRGRIKRLSPMIGNWEGDQSGHGTHVCGSALGNGQYNGNIAIMGTAPKAELIVQSIWCNTSRKFFPRTCTVTPKQLLQDAYYGTSQNTDDGGSRIHLNCWGTPFKGSDRTKGQKPYDNNTFAEELDEFVYEHPDMVICVSAGNDGQEDCTGYNGQIGSMAAAKNCITVGACLSDRKDIEGPAVIAPLSNRGPTAEGRTKPDVVAPGDYILSAASRSISHKKRTERSKRYSPTDDPRWIYNGGTSMATALVAGCVALIREALRKRRNIESPSAALVKAILIHGAQDLGYIRNFQGFGRVDMEKSLDLIPILPNQPTWVQDELKDPDIGRGYVEDYKVVQIHPREYLAGATKTGTLKATLVYSDNPGKEIQNNITFLVSVDQGDGGVDKKYMVTDEDNNVRQLVWPGVKKDANIMLTVTVNGVMIADTQPYALVWSMDEEN